MAELVYVTKRFTFSAAHRYWRRAWGVEENRRRFGPLAQVHGHTYALEVTVRGPVDEATGMVIDLVEMKTLVETEVLARLDHRYLNEDPAFSTELPTTENVARLIWRLLSPKLGEDRLWRVRLAEEPTFWVDYHGPIR